MEVSIVFAKEPYEQPVIVGVFSSAVVALDTAVECAKKAEEYRSKLEDLSDGDIPEWPYSWPLTESYEVETYSVDAAEPFKTNDQPID